MTGRVEALASKVRAFRENLDDTILDVAMASKDELIDANRSQLYDKGMRADGSLLRPYAVSTIAVWKKGRREAPRDNRTENMTLKDYGDFYKSFVAERKNDGIVIDATDWKRDLLVQDMSDTGPGEKIFGLTDESLQEFIDKTMRPKMRARFIQAVKS